MTTNSYFGLSRPMNFVGKHNNITAGSSSTASLEVELRVSVVTSGSHNMTQKEVLDALDSLYHFIKNNGNNFAGEAGASANIPMPIGAPTAGG